ncbi:helix-turn-helix domain-containing protein [Pedobacter sp. BS3]|uniref:helix-turn-helix domain-containing protein n=1 Tax=Pedobacter sp. BS3 TaxID=2567937 RepID=UPI0011EBE5B4|nr:helix-turn-helix transcriptional regulator [Pedobacter sp. BS3]TZF84975.1 helix-turn-helix domain-containing protein [Pedobacter sp. BS3]
MKTLGKKIRLLRHQNGWSQEDVAKRLEISIPAFSKIETGITDVNLSRLEQIAALFEMSVVQLLTFNDTQEQEKYMSELEEMTKKLQEREAEVIDLQKKIIELFEEIRSSKKSST